MEILKKWKKKIDLDIFSKIEDAYIEMEKKNHTVKIEEAISQVEKIVISYYYYYYYWCYTEQSRISWEIYLHTI